MPFPSGLRRKNRDFTLVPVVSAPVEVDPSCCYANLPHFTHFGDSISFVGGINKPKLIQCFDSSGRCHRQLVSCLQHHYKAHTCSLPCLSTRIAT